MNKQKQAFTLVKLIVVITILAILWTIAFISLQSYSSKKEVKTKETKSTKQNNTLQAWWKALDPNCDIDDITIGSQTWAGCNSTLGNGFERWKQDNSKNGTIWSCYPNYDLLDDSINCVIGSTAMTSNTKANTWYAGTNANLDKEYPVIWWKLYTWANAPSACPTGWHLPSEAEWETLETTLNGSKCRNETNSWLCTGLGWWKHNTKTATNNLANALKIPLAGDRDIDGSTFDYRGFTASLWSSSAFDATTAYNRNLNYSNTSVERGDEDKLYGFSVRCMKD